ncbi:DUF3540 domain-containing protein (plasmid) [Pantoea dispersa]|uniref:DUF3540 domain-containing protein n=1 Tax=Pantoea dispersa TaxID=59814 RepID=UPI001CA7A357|nr:DUF3540 domain-containing protein [Pantoea dispersa]QZY93072.1 DUF3540 domain-containing protein [Pantoea dispersa]
MSNVYPLPAPVPLADKNRLVVTLCQHTEGTFYVAELPTLSVQAAVSCLIAPQNGDCVAALKVDDTLWVTDVLHCADTTRPLTLRSAHAELAIEADSLSLRASQMLTLESPKLTLLSRTSRWVAEKMLQVAGHLQTRCRSAERLVRESDSVRAEHIAHQAESSYRVDSELTAVNGRSVLKIDGGQVHVG